MSSREMGVLGAAKTSPEAARKKKELDTDQTLTTKESRQTYRS